MSDPAGRLSLAALIKAARNAVVFTGAGMSTESGVPDFRSPGGVWSRMKPIYFQDFLTREDTLRGPLTRTPMFSAKSAP